MTLITLFSDFPVFFYLFKSNYVSSSRPNNPIWTI